MYIKPIPLHLLTDTAVYEETTNDSWGDGYGSPITLQNVRVEYGSKLRRDSNAAEVTYQAVLFFDSTNSTPLVDFKKGSKVTAKGETMYIEEFEPYYGFDGDTPHHIEVGLR